MNLVLIGHRAAGKTTAGKGLAARVGAPFLDTDAEVERLAGRSIQVIFEEEGEPFFRALERKVLESLRALDGYVIAAGGGAPMDLENRMILRDAGKVVWLEGSAEVLLGRRKAGDRPPLTPLPLEEEVRRLRRVRDPVYAEIADVRLDTGTMSREEIIDALQRIWRAPPT